MHMFTYRLRYVCTSPLFHIPHIGHVSDMFAEKAILEYIATSLVKMCNECNKLKILKVQNINLIHI